jgi:chromodomain-helicase-DNA-binding protein 1
MASSPDPSPANAEASPPAVMSTEFDASDHQSDSDLSEVQEAVVVDPSPSPSPEPRNSVYVNDDDDADGSPDVAIASDDNASDDDASDDADYDVDESAAPSPINGNADIPEDSQSSSQDSRRATKRKLGDDEDDYMQRYPELYGLRRSVCESSCLSHLHPLTKVATDSCRTTEDGKLY